MFWSRAAHGVCLSRGRGNSSARSARPVVSERDWTTGCLTMIVMKKDICLLGLRGRKGKGKRYGLLRY
jgi:hypothetical protein